MVDSRGLRNVAIVRFSECVCARGLPLMSAYNRGRYARTTRQQISPGTPRHRNVAMTVAMSVIFLYEVVGVV